MGHQGCRSRGSYHRVSAGYGEKIVPSSKRTQRKKTTGRASSRRSQKTLGLRTYGLIAAVIVVAVAVVAAIALLGQGTGNAPNQPEGVSLDKSKGAEDAPVVVVVYSDFQCPYCRQFAMGPERQLQEEYVDQGLVRLVYHHLAFIGNVREARTPLTDIEVAKWSTLVGLAAEESARNGCAPVSF